MHVVLTINIMWLMPDAWEGRIKGSGSKQWINIPVVIISYYPTKQDQQF